MQTANERFTEREGTVPDSVDVIMEGEYHGRRVLEYAAFNRNVSYPASAPSFIVLNTNQPGWQGNTGKTTAVGERVGFHGDW